MAASAPSLIELFRTSQPGLDKLGTQFQPDVQGDALMRAIAAAVPAYDTSPRSKEEAKTKVGRVAAKPRKDLDIQMLLDRLLATPGAPGVDAVRRNLVLGQMPGDPDYDVLEAEIDRDRNF
jgi:hypothetical protein